MDGTRQDQRRATQVLAVLAAVAGAGLFALSWQRYTTFHNRTFDLAFYARIAWGLARGDLLEPIVGAHIAGLHLSAVLWPLGGLGRLFGTVPVLLVAQASAYAATAFPLARLAGRRFGSLAYVAAGFYDGFWEVGLNPWDVAAGSLLVQEAGGLIGDLAGDGDFLYGGQVIAAAPKVFAQMVAALAPYRGELTRRRPPKPVDPAP